VASLTYLSLDEPHPVHRAPDGSCVTPCQGAYRLAYRIIPRATSHFPGLLLLASKPDPPRLHLQVDLIEFAAHQLVQRATLFVTHRALCPYPFPVPILRSPSINPCASLTVTPISDLIALPRISSPDRITMSFDRFDRPDILTSRAVSRCLSNVIYTLCCGRWCAIHSAAELSKIASQPGP
jgi:hypothetical protein